MVPLSAEKQQLENGACSMPINAPKFKRRKVFAVRDYPPGCGPNASRINMREGQIIHNRSTDESTEQHGANVSVGDQKILTADGIVSCSNSVGAVAACSELTAEGPGMLMKEDLASDNKLLESQKASSENLLQGSTTTEKPNPSPSLQVKETVSVAGDLLRGSDEHKLLEPQNTSSENFPQESTTTENPNQSPSLQVKETVLSVAGDSLCRSDEHKLLESQKVSPEKLPQESTTTEKPNQSPSLQVKETVSVAGDSLCASDEHKSLDSQNVINSEKVPQESTTGKPNSSPGFQVKQAILSVSADFHRGSDDLKKDSLESKEIIPDSSKLVTVEKETIAFNKVDACSSTHYPIPSNLVLREPSYPPRRRVSAVRDFPPGCGTNGSQLCDSKTHGVELLDKKRIQDAPPVGKRNVHQDRILSQNYSDSSGSTRKDFPLSISIERNELYLSDDGKLDRSHGCYTNTNRADDGKCIQLALSTEEGNVNQDETHTENYSGSRLPAISDFPPAIDKNQLHSIDHGHTQVVPSEERNAPHVEVHAENCNDTILTVLKEIKHQHQHHDDDFVSYKLVAKRGKDLAAAQAADSHKGVMHETIRRLQKPVISSKGKEKHENSEHRAYGNAEDGGQNTVRYSVEVDGKDNDGEMTKDIITYRKDKGDKRRWLVASERYINMNAEKLAADNDVEKNVVLGLPAVKATWRRAMVAVKSSTSISDAKGKKRKTCSTVEEDNMTLVPFEESKAAEESEIKAMSEPLLLEEKGSSEVGAIVSWEGSETPERGAVEEINDLRTVARSQGGGVNFPPLGASPSGNKSARSKVRETLRLFQAVLRKLIQEDETKPKQGKCRQRFDQHAAKILKDKGKYVNTGKSMIGEVSGVEVGDEFHFRVELMMVGLHRQSQGGIDFLRQGDKMLATSVVASGGYDNDLDNTDVLIYTGQGGNLTGGDKAPEDQKLERGNLALKNSIDEGNYVRVIRGYKETDKGKISTMYTYDGLYTVERYWEDRSGPHQKRVYKFELRRVPGQPELAWKEVKKSKKLRVREGLCVEDISNGKEKIPIGVVNTVDDEKPPPFTYITKMMYPDWCSPVPLKGCRCRSRCSDNAGCACAEKNNGEIPYNHDGAIVEVKTLVYECGPSCGCPPSCYNRVSQHGIKSQLEIFKTVDRGWGVRSLSSIPSGSFICEYIGELLEDKEAEQRRFDEYLFDIGHNYSDPSLKEGLEGLMPDSLQSTVDVVADVGFTIDAARYGNVGRFINHSCSPNLYAQNVLFDHEDTRIPHIMLFAAENIPPLQELTYHYNYKIGGVCDKDGNIKVKSCYCGASDCTGRMY